MNRTLLPLLAALALPPANIQAQEPAPYCLAKFRSAEEGAPKYWYEIDCKAGKAASSESGWCWTFNDDRHRACVDRITDKMKAGLSAKGYSEAAAFRFQNPHGGGTRVFRRSTASPPAAQDLCLVLRLQSSGPLWERRTRASYQVDCADKAVTLLADLDEGESTAGISSHMSGRGYDLAERFGDGFTSYLLFKKR